MIERGRVAREICLHEIEVAVEIVVGGGDSHAGLRLAVGAQGATGFERDVDELAIFLVLVEGAGGGVVGNVDVGPAVVVEIGGEHAKTIGAICAENPRDPRDVGEGSVAVVVIQDVFAAIQSRWAARYDHALVETRTRLWHGRGCQVHVDVVRDKQIEAAVAVIVHKRAARVPALAVGGDTGLRADVGEGAISVVVIEHVLAEQIVVAVVVVVADANTLSPTGVADACSQRHIGESAVAIILEQAGDRFVSGGKSFEVRAVHQKNVEPAVVVVVVERDSAARGFEQVFVLVFAAEDRFDVKARFASDVHETDPERSARLQRFDRRLCWWCGLRPQRTRQPQHTLQRENRSRSAE